MAQIVREVISLESFPKRSSYTSSIAYGAAVEKWLGEQMQFSSSLNLSIEDINALAQELETYAEQTQDNTQAVQQAATIVENFMQEHTNLKDTIVQKAQEVASNTTTVQQKTEETLIYRNEAESFRNQAKQIAQGDVTSSQILFPDSKNLDDKILEVNTDIATKVNIADVQDNLISIDTNKPLSANQGKVLKGFIDNINTLLTSEDTSLDSLQEIVNYIKQNKNILEALNISSIAGLTDALNNKAYLNHDHDAKYLGINNKAINSSKLNGFSLAAAAEKLTIPLRDSNGDIHARLFRTDYEEQTNAPLTTADIAFRNNNEADNFVRFMTSNAFKAWLVSIGVKITDTQVPLTSSFSTISSSISASSKLTNILYKKIETDRNFYDAGKRFSSTGYQKFRNGLIIQWGAGGSTSNQDTITFPVSFPNICCAVIPVLVGGGVRYCSLESFNKSKAVVNKSAGYSFRYIAIGY